MGLAALTLAGCASLSGNLAASSSTLSFGSVAIGTMSHQSLTFTNSGTEPSTVTQAVASGGGFNFKGPPLPSTLSAGQSITFTISFAPTAMGNASGSLSITSSQTSSPQLTGGSMPVGQSTTTHLETISMSGTGVPVGPSITTQVASQTVTVGQTATFSVAASGEAPLSYQWQKNGMAISGATSATYTTPVTTTSDSGSQFSAVISNSTRSVTSDTATLTVTASAVAPSITTQPASQTVTAGQTATFSVTSTGTAPPSYQWRKNGISITGATSASYTTPPTAISDSGSQFAVIVSNSTGSVTSNGATLTVTAAAVAPSITTQPVSQTVTAGQTATFSVAGTGTAPLSYQWQKNKTAISGATSASYTTPPTVTSDSGSQFTVTVSNSTGSVTSNNASLTVNATPVAITVNPNNATVTVGSTQQFVGNVTGSSNTAVTWAVSGAGCTGAACGTISGSGLYIPPSSAPSPATVTVTAISVADPTKSASTNVAIVAAVAVLLSITPTSASVPTSGTQLFNASVTGTSNTAASWTLSGAGCSGSSCGTISTSASSAVYSAPSVAPSPASVNVTATSVADPTKSASASTTIVPVVAVTVGPTGASVPTGTTQQFNASVMGTPNTAVAWSVAGTGCSGAACGTIGSSGLYTAPTAVPSPATVTITATSAADQTKSGAANSTIVSSAKAGPVLPTLPQATVDITMPVQTGTVRNVAAGNAAGFQAAINAATCGDTIVLVAGSTYTGNFTIPNKVCSGWILIESSALASLPPSGTRVSGACTAGAPPATICPPPSTSNMATIISGVADNPTFTFQTAAHNWRLIGLEITQAPGFHDYSLIETDNSATTVANLVSYLIIDRCYIHGTASGAVRRGVSFQVANGAIVDSDIREIHDQNAAPGQGSDSQAVGVWTSPGPLLIQNNFLSAASENMLFGGNDPSVANMVPSDITIVGNHYWKDYAAWYGNGYDVKNLQEFKNAQRVLLDGNVIEYSWGDAQVGFAVLLTVRNQNGACTWCVVQDMTVTHNLIQHAASGIETTGSDDANISLPDNRILIQNDVLTDINSATWNGDGRGIFSLTSGGLAHLSANNITVDHVSIFADAAFLYLGDSGTITNYQITNSIGPYGLYGIFGSNVGTGSLALSTYITNAVYNDLVMLTASGTNDGNTWPSGTFWNSTSGAGFLNYSGENYQLTSSSKYHNAGTDGKDIGVWDWSTLNTETTNALAGRYPQ
jgi:hypothetical protein